MTGRYSQFQPVYASLGVTTIPCSTSEKKPLVSHWQRMGIPASQQLATRFTSANAIGIVCGEHNRITVLDVDSTDRSVLKEAVHRHGEPRIIVRTASGKYHAYYRHSGEPRAIRPWKDLPIDVLGGDLVFAPPSLFRAGEYYFLEGGLDDLKRLTPMMGLDELMPPSPRRDGVFAGDKVKKGNRNNWLFGQCLRAAHQCDDLDALLDVARTRNMECEPPMEDTEVMTASMHAWSYEREQRNFAAQRGAWLAQDEIGEMARAPDALTLLAFLRSNEGPLATFMVTNSLHERLRWTLVRLVKARKALIERGYIYQVRTAASFGGKAGRAALYRWRD